MAKQREGIYWDVLRLAATGSPAFIDKAREAKKGLVDKLYQMTHEMRSIDNLVAQLAPDSDWVNGFPSDERGPLSYGTQGVSGRPKAALSIANRIIANGAATVDSRQIAQQMLGQGFAGTVRDMSVSVGNILNRSGKWRRSGSGVYGLIK